MRHVSAHDDADPQSEPEDRRFGEAIVTTDGRTIALQAGYALAETMDHEWRARPPKASVGAACAVAVARAPEPGPTICLLHPGTDVTRRTCQLLRRGIRSYSSPWTQTAAVPEVRIRTSRALLAASASDSGTLGTELGAAIATIERADAEVVVAVMHDPAASWLLQRLANPNPDRPDWRTTLRAVVVRSQLEAWLHGPAQLPMRKGELVMTQRDGSEAVAGGESGSADEESRARHPVWAISPSSEQLILDLRDKISKKMDSAKQLGAFATALFSFAVTGVLREQPTGPGEVLAWIGVGVLGIAVIAFFITLFRYDSLLMPRQMWASLPPREKHQARLGVFERPPSSATWILYQNMMMIWLRGFTVACGLVAIGGVLVVIAISDPTGLRGWGLVAGVLAAALTLSAMVWRGSRPELGVND